MDLGHAEHETQQENLKYMCGIIVMSRPGEPDLTTSMNSALDRITHRGVDDRGIWTGTYTQRGQTYTIGMGHVRLSILDLSPRGHQPMQDQAGNIIVYNGEIYNYLELRQELEPLGHEFHTGTDTEVILAAYRQWGPACLCRFIGMWAFALWDGKRLFISRDRLGKKPLFYHENSSMSSLTLVSELKGFRDVPGIPWRPDERTVYRYLSYGELESGGNTFFEGIREFPAGSYVLHVPGTPLDTPTRFWSLSPETHDVGESEAVRHVTDLLLDSVRLRLRSDAPLGLSLSGGIDSTLLLGLMNEAGIGRPPAFSSSYAEPGYNEKDYFRIASTRLGCEPLYAETQVKDFTTDFEKLVYHLEQPSKLPGPFSLWRVSNLASRHVKVLIDGQGPDELSGGYVYFLPAAFRGYQLPEKIRFAPDLVRTVWANRQVFSQYPLSLILERVMGRTSARRVIPLSNEWARAFSGEQPDWSPSADLDTLLRDAVTRTSLPALLRYGDRVNMAFGIENRCPYLDHRLVEYVSSLPARMKIRGGTTKRIFREVAKGRIPEEIRNRRLKLGFPTPVGEWYRDVLLDDCRQRLGEYRRLDFFRKWVDMDAANVLLDHHAAKRADHQALLWRVLSIGAWVNMMYH